ncbi:MAG TPA: cupin domain-containing protein [Syntrophorhabdales bacterium]|nr:cupin domain-containing protein [Syntrophorhabdales bacterium]
MKITSLDKVEKVEMRMDGAKDAYKQIPVSRADGTPSFSVRVFTIEPGGHTPYHRHAFEHINYVIEGVGAVVSEGGQERPVAKGDLVLILPNELHQYRNSADDRPFVIICAVPKEHE